MVVINGVFTLKCLVVVVVVRAGVCTLVHQVVGLFRRCTQFSPSVSLSAIQVGHGPHQGCILLFFLCSLSWPDKILQNKKQIICMTFLAAFLLEGEV